MCAKLAFPEGFLWGSATASYQIEGGIEDRGRCIWDDFCDMPGKVFQGHSGDIADDHYHLYRDDVALMRQLGMQTYRFSISWPRVLPTGVGQVNEKGLDFYDKLVDELLEAGIPPSVTLYHWDLPSALQKMGGWTVRDSVNQFTDYVEVVAKRLGDRVKSWITHNEPWVVAFLGNLMGIHAPGWQDPGIAFQVAHHLLVSHGLAVPVLRAYGDEETKVGITLNFTPSYPASEKPEDVAAASRHDGFNNRWFVEPLFKGRYDPEVWSYLEPVMPRIMPGDMEIITRPIDFLGVNFYTRSVLQAGQDGFLDFTPINPDGEYTAMEWEVYPQALTELLVRLHKDYAAPDLYITENGCAYFDEVSADGQVHDAKRTAYLKKHFAAAHAAIQQGAPLKGYYVWSLMDNFEWALGYARRFGMVYVDFETQERIPKDSALYYAQVIAQNSVETD